jgi:hypothetical protein
MHAFSHFIKDMDGTPTRTMTLRDRCPAVGNTLLVMNIHKKGHPKVPRFRRIAYENYLMMISTRRFCGSRTPGPVGTSRWVSPKPWIVMALFGTPSFTSSAATA